MASSSVPSAYGRGFFGLRRRRGAAAFELEPTRGGVPDFEDEAADVVDCGREEGRGEVARVVPEPENMPVMVGLDFCRLIDAGMVKRCEMFIDGEREGPASVKSGVCNRPVLCVCDLARDAAVGASYRCTGCGGDGPVSWKLGGMRGGETSREDKDVLRVSGRPGGDGGLMLLCDF
jgi:hypothetical protein